MLQFNTLQFIGQAALGLPQLLPYRDKGKRKRLGKVIDNPIRISCKIVTRARKIMIHIRQLFDQL
jgi:hypothetical protein